MASLAADTTATTASEALASADVATAAEPQKPKKAMSAYWVYLSKMREEVSKECKEKSNGKASLGDIAKATAARWAALSEEGKKPFEKQAAEDKKRYEVEFAAYQEAVDPAGVLRKKYEHLMPKKPMSAYFLFSQDTVQHEKAVAALKEAGVEAGSKQLASKLGEFWKAASGEQKAPFEERHEKEHEDFLQKQKEWQATPEFKEIEEAVSKQAELKKSAGEGEEVQAGKGTKRKNKGEAGSPPSAKKPKAAEEKKAKAEEKPAKLPKSRSTAQSKEPEVAIDADVLAEAGKNGLEAMLRNLAARPEVVASGKSSREMFDALKTSGGLVNVAKRSLIAGGA